MASVSILGPLMLNPVKDRHIIFATDFIHFISQLYGIGWTPRGVGYYFTHVLSPFNNEIGDAIKILLRNRDHQFRQKFEELTPRRDDLHTGVFVNHCNHTFLSFFLREAAKEEMFDILVYLGRLSVIFHQNGAVDTPYMAVYLIGEALYHLQRATGPGMYCSFTSFASDIIRQNQ